jgi:hypothetical protein
MRGRTFAGSTSKMTRRPLKISVEKKRGECYLFLNEQHTHS